ncbi:hypothetical protein [Chitinophaga dinghuensis]|nr:hypothetical protein [Chitinophaga dinghuensis]
MMKLQNLAKGQRNNEPLQGKTGHQGTPGQEESTANASKTYYQKT